MILGDWADVGRLDIGIGVPAAERNTLLNSLCAWFSEERLINFNVILSNYGWPPITRPPSGPKMRECWHQLEQVGDDINLTCTSPTYGRYLYITLLTPGIRYMTLCDVRVYTLPKATG